MHFNNFPLYVKNWAWDQSKSNENHKVQLAQKSSPWDWFDAANENLTRLHSVINKSTAWQALWKHFKLFSPSQFSREKNPSNFMWMCSRRRNNWLSGTFKACAYCTKCDHNSPLFLLFINTLAKHLLQTLVETLSVEIKFHETLIFRSDCVTSIFSLSLWCSVQLTNHTSDTDLTYWKELRNSHSCMSSANWARTWKPFP